MKIDLHCHTKKIKTGDAPTRSVTPDLFAQKVLDAGVSIVAITNHNEFDYEQYVTLFDKVKDYCQVWPGVELDIEDQSKHRFHMIVVANPDNAKAFDAAVNSLIDKQDKETVTFSIKTVVNAVAACDVLYIPHYHKAPAINDTDLQILVDLVPEKYRIFQETTSTSIGVFNNYQYRVIIGSDVQDWAKYQDAAFAELRLPVESFSQFVLLAKRDSGVIETLLRRKQQVQVQAHPHDGVCVPLNLYQEMNIIFGQKGAGKSKILESIEKELVSQGRHCTLYQATERSNQYDLLLHTSGMLRDLEMVGAKNGSQELSEIFAWSDYTPTLFSDYVVWFETQDKNKNKSRMKINNACTLSLCQPEVLKKVKSDWKSSAEVLEKCNEIDMNRYLTPQEIIQLSTILIKLVTATKRGTIDAYIDKESIILTNRSIELIKQLADKNTDTKSRPSTTGFYEYAIGRLHLQKNLQYIKKQLAAKKKLTRDHFGELEGKGTIYITSVYRMLCSASKSAEFSIGIRKLQRIYDSLNSLSSHVLSPDAATYQDDFKKACGEADLRDLTPFLGLSKITTTENGEEYTPSNGEKGILILQQTLRDEADAYLIDEPELGMGNSYIDQCIRPLLSDLAKRQKIVVVATHNANIAVRTLPYQSIFRKTENGRYLTYVGNPFTNNLVNIENPNDTLIWKTESLHTLEGGEEAFYEREHIYESGSHQC